jgi:hypothetical protein
MPGDAPAEVPRNLPAGVFSRSSGRTRVTLSVEGDFLRIDVAGEALDKGIVDCFREAIAAGAVRANMSTLVDLSNFTGGVDWPSIHAIADLIAWGSEPDRPSRVAYVTKSAWFSALLKLVTILFPKSQHRQFSGVHNAIQWLNSERSGS